jgi:hypothetical protein
MNSDIKLAHSNAGELTQGWVSWKLCCVQAKAVRNLDHS